MSNELTLKEAFHEEKLRLGPPFSFDAPLQCDTVDTDESSTVSSMESSTGCHSHQTSGSLSSTDELHIHDPYEAVPNIRVQVYLSSLLEFSVNYFLHKQMNI